MKATQRTVRNELHQVLTDAGVAVRARAGLLVVEGGHFGRGGGGG